MTIQEAEVRGRSKAYNRAVSMIASRFGFRAEHGRRPSQDFRDALDRLSSKFDALQASERGAKAEGERFRKTAVKWEERALRARARSDAKSAFDHPDGDRIEELEAEVDGLKESLAVAECAMTSLQTRLESSYEHYDEIAEQFEQQQVEIAALSAEVSRLRPLAAQKQSFIRRLFHRR